MAFFGWGGGGGGGQALNVRDVRLNVYDLYEGNSWLGNVGMGAYHTGVEVSGKPAFASVSLRKCFFWIHSASAAHDKLDLGSLPVPLIQNKATSTAFPTRA